METERLNSTALTSRYFDFWLLGGASIVLWIAFAVGQIWKSTSWAVAHHFSNLPFIFATLAVFVNYPHFILSYKIAYSRGHKFLRAYWLQLVLVPVLMALIFIFAYLTLNSQIDDQLWTGLSNRWLDAVGISFQFGATDTSGLNIVSLMVLLMYVTVGWHYSKQVFGCMVVYARYDKYPLTRRQRTLVKYNLYSVAVLNFFVGTEYVGSGPGLFNVPPLSPTIPPFLMWLAYAFVTVSTALFVFGVLVKNYSAFKRLPTANFLVSWAALFVWWIPIFRISEYYYFAAPFFHSLQYLPFAYRIEAVPVTTMNRNRVHILGSLAVVLLLLVSFASFEGIPGTLDQWLNTKDRFDIWFFMAAAAVFINIHHFFLDSVTWKLSDVKVRDKLFSEPAHSPEVVSIPA